MGSNNSKEVMEQLEATQIVHLPPSNYQRQYEPCFYGWFNKSSFTANRKQTELWNQKRPRASKTHPTMKPVDLCAHAIRNSSNQGDVVLDLFGGSGSTLMACERLGRKCRMMEFSPGYCEVIVQRFELMTGNKAERITIESSEGHGEEVQST